MKASATVKNLLGAAAILIILGIGNISLGLYKSNQYARILSSAERALATRQTERPNPLSDPSVIKDQKLENIARIKARIGFYEFIKMGGEFFLASAGVCLLTIAWIIKSAGTIPEDRGPT